MTEIDNGEKDMQQNNDFGHDMRTIMSLMKEQKAKDPAKKAIKEKKERVITYEFKASGIDFTMTRVLNGKPTRTLVVFLSQKDDDGHPIIAFKEKDSLEVYEVNRMVSFMDGVASRIPTGSTSLAYIPTEKRRFAEFLERVRTSDNISDLVRMGLIDLDIAWELKSYSYGDLRVPWFCDDGSVYSTDFLELLPENYHPKLVKAAVGYNMKAGLGLDYNMALKEIYTDYRRSEERKTIRYKEMIAFVTLANRYDEPFALKCMAEYIDNDNLHNLNYDDLNAVLKMYRPGVIKTDRWGYEKIYSEINLIKERLPKEEEEMVIQFDKNRLWEFLQHSIAVGMGKNLSNYITLWKDYLYMSRKLYDDIKDKYPEVIQLAHDLCQEKYNISKNEDLKRRLTAATEEYSKICDIDYKDDDDKEWQFRILRTALDFSMEAAQQSNCVASYMDRCANGRTIVGSLRPKGDDNTMVTIEVSMDGLYRFIQVKERFNHEPSKAHWDIINAVEKKIRERHDKAEKDKVREQTVE